MSKSSDGVKRWRSNTKKLAVDSLGGKCCICGYNKCNDSLDIHHLVPSEKEFSISRIMAHPCTWEKIVSELKKCVLICKNCHGEVHASMSVVPDSALRFDEKYVNIKQDTSICPVCGDEKPLYLRTCCRSCASNYKKVEWSKVDLPKMLQSMSISKIADSIDVTFMAVKKRMVKLGLVTSSGTTSKNKIGFVSTECKKCKQKFDYRRGNIRDFCSQKCCQLSRRKVERPLREELESLLKNKSRVAIGKMFGVSETAVRKWIKSYSI